MIQQHIEINGFKLKYCIDGKGIPTLVIGSAIYYPRVFSKNLREHLKMAFIDHRGFGATDKIVNNSAFELNVLIDDIEHIRQALKFEKFIIIGHSGHGYMALEYAKRYPQHVSHVVLIGMGPNHSAENHAVANQHFEDMASAERKIQFQKDLELLPLQITENPEQRFITFCIRFGARSWCDYMFDATPLWKDVTVNMQMFDYVWGEVFRDIDITKNLSDFNVPVFLGLGKYDFLVAPPSSWESIIPRFKKLTIHMFEYSGHTPSYEESETFDCELLKWLANS